MMTMNDELSRLANLFKLLVDPAGLRVVTSYLDVPISVREIAESNALSASLVSRHLRLLRNARIVMAKREGRQIFYSAADRHLSGMIKGVLDHIAGPSMEIE